MVRFRRSAPVCPAPAGSPSLRGMTSTWLNRQIIRLGPEHRPVKTGHLPPTSSIHQCSVPRPLRSPITSPRTTSLSRENPLLQKRHHRPRLPPSPMFVANTKHSPGTIINHHHFETQRTHRRIPTLHIKCLHQSPDLSPLMVSLGPPPPLAPRVEKHLQTPLKSTCFNVCRGPLRAITLCQMEHLRSLNRLCQSKTMGHKKATWMTSNKTTNYTINET